MNSEDQIDGSFSKRMLKANANIDFISVEFAEVMRDLMRAFSSRDSSLAVYKAAERMNFVVDLLSETDEKFGFLQLFAKAIEVLQDDPKWGTVEHATVEAARSGVKFLVERSCRDNASKGRTARRENAFLDALKHIEAVREYQLRKPRAKL